MKNLMMVLLTLIATVGFSQLAIVDEISEVNEGLAENSYVENVKAAIEVDDNGVTYKTISWTNGYTKMTTRYDLYNSDWYCTRQYYITTNSAEFTRLWGSVCDRSINIDEHNRYMYKHGILVNIHWEYIDGGYIIAFEIN